MSENKVKSIVIPTLVLFLICAAITLALSATNALTEDRIAENSRQKLAQTMEELIPADSYEPVYPEGEDETGDPSVYRALDARGSLSGMIFITGASGYGGEISVMTGIAGGEIAAVRVLDCSNETPGLGQNTKNPDFTDRFNGISQPPTLVKGSPAGDSDVAAITGATISSNAVVEAVRQAMQTYESLEDATLE